MQIELTSAEFRLLLDTVSIADWIMHARDEEEREDTADHRKLFQKILAHAPEAGCEELVFFDDELGEYFETEEFETRSPAMDLIDEYDEDGFWGELASRLAERDAIREVGEDAYYSLSDDGRIRLLAELEEDWSTELEDYGLDRLEVFEEGAP